MYVVIHFYDPLPNKQPSLCLASCMRRGRIRGKVKVRQIRVLYINMINVFTFRVDFIGIDVEDIPWVGMSVNLPAI